MRVQPTPQTGVRTGRAGNRSRAWARSLREQSRSSGNSPKAIHALGYPRGLNTVGHLWHRGSRERVDPATQGDDKIPGGPGALPPGSGCCGYV